MQSTTMTVNLRKGLLRLHTARRRKRAMGLLKEAVARFTKSDLEKIKIHKDVNTFIERNASGASFLWARMKLSVEKSENKVEVKLPTTKPETKVEAKTATPTTAAKAPEAPKQKPEEKPKKA